VNWLKLNSAPLRAFKTSSSRLRPLDYKTSVAIPLRSWLSVFDEIKEIFNIIQQPCPFLYFFTFLNTLAVAFMRASVSHLLSFQKCFNSYFEKGLAKAL
jgi:hypothetical protein